MSKTDIGKTITLTSTMIFLLGLIIFVSLIRINYSLVIGWMVGGLLSIFTFLLSIHLINLFFKKRKSKTLGFWMGTLRFYIKIIIFAISTIIIIIINNKVNGNTVFGGGLNSMESPINIFTYLGGIGIIPLGMFINQIIERKEKDV